MKKQELYKELRMDEFYCGDSFIVDRDKTTSDIIHEIDAICISEQRKPLADKWNEMKFSECSEMLFNAFNFDLAYQGCARMPTDKAEYFGNFLVAKFKESETKCFTKLVSKSLEK